MVPDRTRKAAEPPFEAFGSAARHPFAHPNDDFVQAGDLYRKVTTGQDRSNPAGNIVDHLKGAKRRSHLRQTAQFFKADPEYGRRVAEGLGLDAGQVERLACMSAEERAAETAMET